MPKRNPKSGWRQRDNAYRKDQAERRRANRERKLNIAKGNALAKSMITIFRGG